MAILSPMSLIPKRTISSIILVLVLIAILVTLAVLQYRWSGQVSQAERERMQTSMRHRPRLPQPGGKRDPRARLRAAADLPGISA